MFLTDWDCILQSPGVCRLLRGKALLLCGVTELGTYIIVEEHYCAHVALVITLTLSVLHTHYFAWKHPYVLDVSEWVNEKYIMLRVPPFLNTANYLWLSNNRYYTLPWKW